MLLSRATSWVDQFNVKLNLIFLFTVCESWVELFNMELNFITAYKLTRALIYFRIQRNSYNKIIVMVLDIWSEVMHIWKEMVSI